MHKAAVYPQAIAARHLHGEEERSRLLSLRLAFGRSCSRSSGSYGGASIGREGLTVQVGASIMLQAARWGGMAHARGLILAGSAAGSGRIQHTRWRASYSRSRKMSRTLRVSRKRTRSDRSPILSGLAALSLSGNYTYFGTSSTTASGAKDFLAHSRLRIGGGLLGAAFSAASLRLTRRIRRWAQPPP